MTTNQTPLWLEIKTEYIDANLDKVITYLSTVAERDGFYSTTVELLGKRVQELCLELSRNDIWEADENADRDSLLSSLRLLGAAILVNSQGNLYFFFIKTLSSLVSSSFVEQLTQIAVNSLTNKIASPGFSWSDIRNVMPEVLATKIIASASFSEDYLPETWFQGKGSLRIKDGFVELHASNKDTASRSRTASSLKLLEEHIMVQSNPGDRIQQRDEDNLEVMDKFTVDFLHVASETKPSVVTLRQYSTNEMMPVRFKGVDMAGNLLVETVEGDHEKISGTVSVYINGALYYKTPDFAQYLHIGDILDAKLLSENKKTFSLNEGFVDAVVSEVVKTQDNIPAFLLEVKKDKMVWWTQDGYPAYSDIEERPEGTPYEVGDYATIYITECKSNGYVHASVIGPSEENFDKADSMDYCIGKCVYSEDATFSKAQQYTILDESFVRGLDRLLFNWQRTVGQASERFRILCVCRILARMTDDEKALEYINLSCTYLRNLVSFATGQMDRIKNINPSSLLEGVQPVALRAEVTRILLSYGVDDDSDYLSGIIHDENANQILKKLAKLIQSCNRIDDVYPAIKTVIKREITKFLAVETEDNADFEEAAGPNLGVENSRQEFKTSFFFAPPSAKEQNQEKTIFRSLCSFLNTQEGGTLYLGVNDSGGVNGLENDLQHLQRKIAGTYKGIDGYIRYITDRAKQYFDLDVRIHFRIEPLYEGKVVAINVEPYEHGVVEFDNVPYIRNNSESVRMSQALRHQIEVRRLNSVRDRSGTVIDTLANAINEERGATFFAYASSNSREIRNRQVEPFAFVGNHTYVWAYDLEDGKCKLFRVSRIRNVKVTDTWKHKAEHVKSPIDIFHFQGEDNIPIKLELDLLAKNLLVEEYPEAQNELVDLGEGRWLLDTIVHKIDGIGRFYAGLSRHIRIIDAPKLVDFARNYFTEALGRL